MKWITHQVAAVLAGLSLHMPEAGLVAAVAGAVLPDVLDQRMAGLALTRRGRQRLFNAVHRGTTHWFGWWLVLCAASPFGSHSLWGNVIWGLGIGSISHILLDMLTPAGVPLWPFSRRPALSFRLCSTGSVGEYVFLFVLTVGGWLLFQDDIGRLTHALEHSRLFRGLTG